MERSVRYGTLLYAFIGELQRRAALVKIPIAHAYYILQYIKLYAGEHVLM